MQQSEVIGSSHNQTMALALATNRHISRWTEGHGSPNYIKKAKQETTTTILFKTTIITSSKATDKTMKTMNDFSSSQNK